jgi:hypothetical protein
MLRMLAEPGFHRAGEGTSYAIRVSSDRGNPHSVPGHCLLFCPGLCFGSSTYRPFSHVQTKKPEVQNTSGFYSTTPER